jgi:histidine triad (HIT) family protein
VGTDCAFCRIVAHESPADIEYEDDQVLAFKDLYPKAPIHLLIVPKRHIDSLARTGPGDTELLGRCVQTARLLGERTGYAERGYRLTCNTGPDGGQVVFHIHFHFTAGSRRQRAE